MFNRRATERIIDAEGHVRANTARAGFVAGLLIFLGYFVLDGAVGTPAYVKSATVLFYALRVGGLVMVGVAVWSAIGSPAALVLDSIACGALGAVLLYCALGFVSASSLPVGLMCLAGAVSFLVSCYHLIRDYRLLPTDEEAEVGGAPIHGGGTVGQDTAGQDTVAAQHHSQGAHREETPAAQPLARDAGAPLGREARLTGTQPVEKNRAGNG